MKQPTSDHDRARITSAIQTLKEFGYVVMEKEEYEKQKEDDRSAAVRQWLGVDNHEQAQAVRLNAEQEAQMRLANQEWINRKKSNE